MSALNEADLAFYLSGFWLTDLANFSAYIYEHLPDLNWVGFYLNDGTKLRLGPFIGRPACMEIPFGRGVCGEAFAQNKSLRVADVDEFPGHIRCDSRSRSELVLPFSLNGTLIGILDLDSPTVGRFTAEDQRALESALQVLSRVIEKNTVAPGFGAVTFKK
jgi:GAF domain-containing protein